LSGDDATALASCPWSVMGCFDGIEFAPCLCRRFFCELHKGRFLPHDICRAALTPLTAALRQESRGPEIALGTCRFMHLTAASRSGLGAAPKPTLTSAIARIDDEDLAYWKTWHGATAGASTT